MHTGTNKAKQSIREQVRARVAAASPADRARWSAGACVRLAAADAFGAAGSVMIYWPLPPELDVSGIARAALAAGKRVCLPRMDWESKRISPVEIADLGRDLVVGRYGIQEPGPDRPVFPLDKVDLIVVPGLAFDITGNRLGRGAGFYDRFLAETGMAAATCGVCFEIQVMDRLPTDDWDIPLNFLATEDRFIEIP